jgi:hypothetical protein
MAASFAFRDRWETEKAKRGRLAGKNQGQARLRPERPGLLGAAVAETFKLLTVDNLPIDASARPLARKVWEKPKTGPLSSVGDQR